MNPEKRKERAALGFCSSCGTRKATKKRKTCAQCRERSALAYAARVQPGAEWAARDAYDLEAR